MISAVGRSFVWRRAAFVFLALAVLATGFTVAATEVGLAQEEIRRSWTLRDMFRPRKSDRVEKVREVAPKKSRKKRAVRRKEKAEPRQRVVATKEVEKQEDAMTVMVVGDFLGSGLADGLTQVFVENPRVRVIDRTSGSSGFVRDDYYDWPGKIGELIEDEKPAAIVVMLGANDRQQMRVGGERESPRSEKWDRQYAERTEAMANAIADRGVPFIWVGVPAFKSQKMTTDMLAFNDFYRSAAEGVGAEFVDIWDGFVDENGAYVSTGPDINGQPVRLRGSDGINLTRSGKRKVAFYAEKPLAKLLGEAAMQGIVAVAPTDLPKLEGLPPVDIGSIDRTVPVSLRDPALDGGTELLGQVVAPKREAGSPGEKLAIEGIAPQAKPGRADDFSWNPAEPATTTGATGR